jgi:hypothetical protein
MKIKHVSKIQDGKISVSDRDNDLRYRNETEILDLIEGLIEDGYAFTDEPAGWSPSAVLQDMKAKGIFNKAFTAITWSGPNDHRVFKVP